MPRAKAKITLKAKRAKSKTSGSSSRPHAAFRKWDHIPRLVVFDLDFTLWFPEMYELWGAPFKKNPKTGVVTDCKGEQVHFFGAVHTVLSILETDPQF
ncbi:Acid Phosphatase [Phytophthora infestans]|nr:Acid Phosphatase [Phytophthora infestans]